MLGTVQAAQPLTQLFKGLLVEGLTTQATLAKAQSDLLSAPLNYRLALTELRHASGPL